jgi:hypothetical protein
MTRANSRTTRSTPIPVRFEVFAILISTHARTAAAFMTLTTAHDITSRWILVSITTFAQLLTLFIFYVWGDKMETSDTTCNWLAKILHGNGSFDNGVCTVTINRNNLQATIGNVPYYGINHRISFGIPDINGNSLITGELVLREGEVPNMVGALSRAGIIVSAVDSHWILDNPKLMYIHVMSISNRVAFANNLARILNVVTGHSLS